MSTITTTYPIRKSSSRQPSTTAGARPWGFWATLAWFGVAVATIYAVAFLAERAYAAWWEIAYPGQALNMLPLGFLTLALIPSAAVLVLVLAARLAGVDRIFELGGAQAERGPAVGQFHRAAQ